MRKPKKSDFRGFAMYDRYATELEKYVAYLEDSLNVWEGEATISITLKREDIHSFGHPCKRDAQDRILQAAREHIKEAPRPDGSISLQLHLKTFE